MVSSPPGSLVQRASWCVALGLAAAFLLPEQAVARFVATDPPPTVAYTIDGTQGNNGWYVGSASGAFIVVHWSVSGTITSTTGCEPAIRIDDPNTGTTLTCTASGPGGTTSITTKLLKVDATPPSTSVAPSRAPNGAGWYRAPVSLQWSGTDSTSGIASCTSPLTYDGPDTSGADESGTCSDNAGNWSAAALTVHYDSTAPATTSAPSPAPNANGWLNSAVQVGWNGSDSTSGIASCDSATTYDGGETSGTTLAGNCTDRAGNTGSASFVVRYDKTPPVTTAVPARAANSAGWYRTAITISGTGADALSGMDSCTSTTYSGPDTSGTSKSVTCTDKAGNSSSGSYVVKYDATPPAVGAATRRTPDQGAWFNHPVDVDFSGSDGLSGVSSCSSLTYGGPDNANASVQGSCTDVAGNSATATFGVKYDSTPPVTTPSPSPAPNANGWLKSKVDVAWNGIDATSGVASCSAKSTYSGPDTAGTAVSGACTDNAGNTAGSSFTVHYDATAPSTNAAPARAPNGAGWFSAPVTIAGGGGDGLSGVDSCTSTSYGGPDTTGTSRSVSCTDKAGNSSSDSYTVKYDATPPALTTPTAARTPDSSGWYNHAVRVDWHGTDATSGVASCSSPTYAGPDGANATAHGICTDAAGNTASSDFALQYDSTPPTVGVSAARPADHDGWYNRPVSISWSGTDATSGIGSCTAALTYSGPDSSNASSGGGCTDRAGNSASPPALSFRYDATPPAVRPAASRPPDSNGWYNHGLKVDWSGADPVSGIASCSSFSYDGPDTATLEPSGTCTDRAGNTSAPAAFGFRFDATPPSGIAAGAARPPDHDGWYNRPFAVSWSGSDALSGIASCTTATYGGPTNIATALTGSCTDQAGNASGSVGYPFRYDSTPPAFDGLSLTPRDKAVTVRWHASGATGFKVTRKPGIGSADSSVVYDGPASSFADRKVDNYVRYVYSVTAEDGAGNELARSASAMPMPVLYAPRPGARVSPGSSPLLAWRPALKTRYYNVQLWLEGRQVGSWWPARPRLRMPARWRFGGTAHRLEAGAYTWYVWPGRGPRRAGRYGPLLGQSTFVVGSR